MFQNVTTAILGVSVGVYIACSTSQQFLLKQTYISQHFVLKLQAVDIMSLYCVDVDEVVLQISFAFILFFIV